ncbi:CGNR zinc finger domain-containing protein [Amycolatopsis thermophila]|uniref:RNA-binding Zn ribbon-like protein n=1 Tax=Amycolatopsis thermophila TaxID=206084 RepID=A0ABU0EZ82_9PSEU|nr:CGNR zinc finger domain-containing protein [Amycolatopsis thermophila]MDQ0380624.1 putative RNA-binding Zn ribbon-like protein [Amycolatopsis thermophila]
MASSRPAAPAELLPLQLFGNSARLLYDEDNLSSPDEATGWLASHGFGEPALDSPSLERLVRFRETLRDHLGGQDVTAALNSFAAAAVAGPRWSAGGPALAAAGTGGDELIARLLDILFRAEVTGRARRLKPCRAPECRWLFWDRSPAGNGVWCTMDICGARHKMRTYRSRR